MNKSVFTVLGFLSLMFGVLSLVLSLVGVKLAFLVFIDAFGRGFGFLIKLMMILGGIIMIVISRSQFDGGTLEDVP